MVENTNPLNKYYRQPAIYISLPTKGRYYSAQTYTATQTGEIPVLPMTAKDEMSFKTPDAMINGQATVDVIRSCCPNILDPWQLTNYDLDTVLLGIRIATYGETMDINATVPVVNEQMGHTINLPSLLETVKNVEIKDSFRTKNGFTVHIKPLTYKDITDTQVKTFEQQKIVATVNSSQLSEEEKKISFLNKAFIFQKVNEVDPNLVYNYNTTEKKEEPKQLFLTSKPVRLKKKITLS